MRHPRRSPIRTTQWDFIGPMPPAPPASAPPALGHGPAFERGQNSDFCFLARRPGTLLPVTMGSTGQRHFSTRTGGQNAPAPAMSYTVTKPSSRCNVTPAVKPRRTDSLPVYSTKPKAWHPVTDVNIPKALRGRPPSAVNTRAVDVLAHWLSVKSFYATASATPIKPDWETMACEAILDLVELAFARFSPEDHDAAYLADLEASARATFYASTNIHTRHLPPRSDDINEDW